MSYEKMRRCVKCGVSGYFGQRRDCPFGSCDGKLVQVDEVPSVADLAILDNLRLAQRIADLEAELARLRAAPEVTVERVEAILEQFFTLKHGVPIDIREAAEALVAGLRHAEKP